MSAMIERFYRQASPTLELCFNVETSEPLTADELKTLTWLLAETFEPGNLSRNPMVLSKEQSIIEVGPRLNFATAFSTNAVGICHACGLTKVTRLERSRRYVLPSESDQDIFLSDHHDRMTECHYPQPLETFATGIQPEAVYIVPLIEEGIDALRHINEKMGLGMDEWDLKFYYNLFVNDIGRDPTNVECFQLGQANSEHSRHWFFGGKLVQNGQELSKTLFQIVKAPLKANATNSVIAFSDNASAILGYRIQTLIPENPGSCSAFTLQSRQYHITLNAETHNFPSGVAPFPGAETGTGGRIRDGQGVGQGGMVIAGTAGYCTGSLNIPNYLIPGEDPNFTYPNNLATPLTIMIEESNGASDYGNKFGEPVIQGFVRTFGLRVHGGERREWVKPIMFTGGVGQIDDQHTTKNKPEVGMAIIQIGGPAYRIGIGGGAASSMIQGANAAELDFNAVQRGDAEMEQKVNRVIRACIEMGAENPILSIHDQGAGGPCNVLTELVEPAGGRIDIRQIQVGDDTMSVLEIWGAEYQERDAFLIHSNRLEEFRAICQREKVNCEVLGEITGDGRIVVHDSQDDSHPVDLDLSKILCNMPQKTFHIDEAPEKLVPLDLPEIRIEDALQNIFRLPSVGSKGYLVRKVDRSVTGLVARQQCCGPLQLPVSDVSVVAQSHFGLTGGAIAIGEQPIKMLVNPTAGARMSVAEAMTNLVFARISDLTHVKCSGNWMWAGKLPGEGAKMHAAASAMSDLMIKLGIAVDGGKDSLSMAAKVGEETVKAPGQLVISAYATVPDITKVITPDIKRPGDSSLLFLDLAPGKHRLGGSALAQTCQQIGDESPDVDNPELLRNTFLAVQEMIDQGLILAGHDVSDGGLITTLVEMAMAGNCGIRVEVPDNGTILESLFSEELGLVLEVLPTNEPEVDRILKKHGADQCSVLGNTHQTKRVLISHNDEVVLTEELETLLGWWESTSDQLELLQMDTTLAKQQAKNRRCVSPAYSLSFEPHETPSEILTLTCKPKVAIIREEGSNGDREMTSAFFAAGFTPVDVTMTDLLNGIYNLDSCRGVVFVGGFSYADTLDSAKGWAGIIQFNPTLREMFERFYQRKDTFSLGVCNGCQLMALLGWVPWKGIDGDKRPRFIHNTSRRFESRWVTTRILPSPSIMLSSMTDSVLGIWIAHGEGQLYCPDPTILTDVVTRNLAPMVYTDEVGDATEMYPLNPNGSPKGITALCSPDGRHLAMMPHPERVFLNWQWPWMPEHLKSELSASPWLQMFQNARQWCEQN